MYPVVEFITPDGGSASGGTNVVITGRRFTGATSVTFDGVAALSFSVVDDTTINAQAPAGTLFATVSVVIVTPAGSSAGAIVLTDSSGNGNDGIYGVTLPDFLPYGLVGIPDGDALTTTPAHGSVSNAGAALGGSVDANGTVSCEFWYSMGTDTANGVSIIVSSSGGQQIAFRAPVNDGPSTGSASVEVVGDYPLTLSTPVDTLPVDGTPHHVMLTYDPTPGVQAELRTYVDGSLVDTQTVAFAPPVVSQALDQLLISAALATVDELALFAGGDFPHFSSGGSYAGYEAAVLGDSPVFYYRFDDDRRNGSFTFTTAGGWNVGRVGVG